MFNLAVYFVYDAESESNCQNIFRNSRKQVYESEERKPVQMMKVDMKVKCFVSFFV